uniref:Capsid assembly scaffolding protein n=1 Tax=Pseudomonas phage PMBT23 TaxID=3137284 RepID=A0AAU8BWB5_9VIRU
MSDIYAEFGVNGAVMSSNNITEHEQNMLALPTNVRDGDDAITLAGEEQADEQELNQDTDQADDSEQENEDQAQEEDGSDSDDFTPLGEPDAELVESSKELDEYAEGFQQLRAQAIKQGLDASIADAIEAEYERDNKLSESSLKALEAVGYSRGFVRSFIAGQEAVATKYVQQIQAFAGGADKFAQVISHLSANSPDAVAALEDAMGRQDLNAVKTIINLGMQSRTKKFGKAPERAVNKRASAPTVAAKGPQGFASQREMIAAMSDKRYQDDPEYRRSVEAKVGASSW